MKKFYIRYKEDVPETEVQACALYGFRARGIETAPFYGFGDIQTLNDLGPEVGIAGYVGDIWDALEKLGIDKPPAIDYPEPLVGFLGRKIKKISLGEVRKITHQRPFVKPVKHKLFTGFVCTGTVNDQIRISTYDDNEECWVSDRIRFSSEYRCFILNKKILSVRWYKGDWSIAPNKEIIEKAITMWETSPAAYALDFGIYDNKYTVLVEANDGFALGTYGLQPELYAQMLEARWKELVQ